MKKNLLLLLMLLVISGISSYGQGALLKKVTNAMKDELLGTGKSSKTVEPEPSCACNDAEQVVGLGGNLLINYKEMDISTADDGSLLLRDRISGDFYIVKDGVTTGPVRQGDSRISAFDDPDGSADADYFLTRYKEYIKKSGDKYTITFNGKSYGPFSQISSFAVTRQKDQFAAIVVENIPVSEMEGVAMDKAIENARTEQEKMALAMEFSQQMQEKILQGGGPAAMTPKLVSNVDGALSEFTDFMGLTLNGKAKYDEIVLSGYNKVNSLQGKTLITLQKEHLGAPGLFVSTNNSKYAVYSYGTIQLSDGTSLTDLFNPHLIRTGGQVYLAYMYFSPKKNAIMQCRIAF